MTRGKKSKNTEISPEEGKEVSYEERENSEKTAYADKIEAASKASYEAENDKKTDKNDEKTVKSGAKTAGGTKAVRFQSFSERVALTVAMLVLAVYVVVMGGAAFSRFRNGENIYFDYKVARFAEENEDEEKGGVVFVGDSITDFLDLDKFYPGLDAVNRGISGDLTIGLKRRMDVSIFDLEPRLVVLLIGVNDLGRRTAPEKVAANLIDIISEIRERLPGTKLIVQSVYPVSERWGKAYFKRVAPGVIKVNEVISEAAAEYGYTYVNVYEKLVDGRGRLRDELNNDGLHPNDKGYEVVSEVLRPIIDEVLAE